MNPSTASGSIRSGTARFSSSALSVTNDEFYQFRYIHKKTINLASSIPFQLNCPLDDINYFKPNEQVAFDHDDDVAIITHPKHTSTEGKFRPVDRLLSAPTNVFNDSDQLRSRLAATIQLTQDQATQIVQLERYLIQANQSVKQSDQQRLVLEQQLRDQILTSEKHQRSLEGQLQHEQQLRDLTLISDKYQRSMQGQLKQSSNQQMPFERQLRDSKFILEKYQRSMQGQLNANGKQTIQREDQVQTFSKLFFAIFSFDLDAKRSSLSGSTKFVQCH